MGIGFTTEGRMIFNHLSVLDNLKLGAYGFGMRKKRDIDSALENVFQLFPVLKEKAKQMAAYSPGPADAGNRENTYVTAEIC